jgi:hypothetical protein
VRVWYGIPLTERLLFFQPTRGIDAGGRYEHKYKAIVTRELSPDGQDSADNRDDRAYEADEFKKYLHMVTPSSIVQHTDQQEQQ